MLCFPYYCGRCLAGVKKCTFRAERHANYLVCTNLPLDDGLIPARLNLSEPHQGNVNMMLTTTSDNQKLNKLFVTAVSPQQSSMMTSNGKLHLCGRSSPKERSSKTSDRGLISKEEGYSPFWNLQCEETSLKLWLPTKIELGDSEPISLNGFSKKAVEHSWFSTTMFFPPNKSLLKISSQSSTYSVAECTDSEVTATKLLRISPTQEQKKKFKHWTDVSRYVFNQTIDYIRSCVNFTPTWMDISIDLLKHLPHWCDNVPFEVKKIAINEAVNTFWKAKGRPHFRRRKDPQH